MFSSWAEGSRYLCARVAANFSRTHTQELPLEDALGLQNYATWQTQGIAVVDANDVLPFNLKSQDNSKSHLAALERAVGSEMPQNSFYATPGNLNQNPNAILYNTLLNCIQIQVIGGEGVCQQ